MPFSSNVSTTVQPRQNLILNNKPINVYIQENIIF